MRVAPFSHEVKLIVARTFLELGADVAMPGGVAETFLVDSGKIRAHSYRCGDFMAMWMIDVGLLQFYDEDGAMLRTVNLFEEQKPVRLAA